MLLSLLTRLSVVCLVGAAVVAGDVTTAVPVKVGSLTWAGLPARSAATKIAATKRMLQTAGLTLGIPIDVPIIMTSYPSKVGDCALIENTSPVLYQEDFCALDGSTTMRVLYTDSSCSTAYAAASTTTDQTASPVKIVTCLDFYISPDLPYSIWPPTGWLTTTHNFNSATQLETCAIPSTDVHWFQTTAQPLNSCQERLVDPEITSPTAGLYTSSFCVTGGAQYGTAIYSDPLCSTNPPLRVELKSTGCVDNALIACPSPAVVFPGSLPTASRTVFDTEDCTGTSTTTLYKENFCLDSVIVTCVPDATFSSYAISYTTFADSTKAGLCPTTTVDSKWSSTNYAASTQYSSAPICLPDGFGRSTQYYCQATSPPPTTLLKTAEKDL